jgi:hypothetical protein
VPNPEIMGSHCFKYHSAAFVSPLYIPARKTDSSSIFNACSQCFQASPEILELH